MPSAGGHALSAATSIGIGHGKLSKRNSGVTEMSTGTVDLVMHGYTISVKNAALGRIGPLYVMRDAKGHRITLPVATESRHLCEVWAAFRRAVAVDRPMPAILCGEPVSSEAESGTTEDCQPPQGRGTGSDRRKSERF